MSTSSQRIEVRIGEAVRKQVEFTSGKPVDPFTVGSAGGWVVSAPGVAEAHAYLYFDGVTLFVARIGSASVTMAGHEIGEGWVPVQVPMNIHLAGAKLAVRGPTTSPPGALRSGPSQPAPQFQPGVGSPSPVIRESRGDAPREVPVDSEKTVVQHPEAAWGPGGTAVTDLPASERTRYQPVVPLPDIKTQPAQHASPRAKTPITRDAPLIKPDKPSPNDATSPALQVRRMPRTGAPGAPAGSPPFSPSPGAVHASASPGAHFLPGSPPGIEVPRGTSPPTAAAGSKMRRAVQTVLAVATKSWREASIVQKIILVLLPFGFAAVLIVFRSPPPPRAVRNAVSAAPSSSDSVVARSAAPQVPSSAPIAPSSASARPLANKARGPHPPGVTPERRAADAMAEGDYAAALRDYEALAAAHPDKPVYQVAVKILKNKLRK